MAISDRTRKMLWGRSGNRCPLCKGLLIVPDGNAVGTVVGQECHIRARKPDGARHDPNLSVEGLDSYENLILLCSPHHKVVDDSPGEFTVECLLKLKYDHEQEMSSFGLGSSWSVGPEYRASRPPSFLDSFVGREEDVEALQKHLSRGARLITLVGTGGVGKTRLAADAAERIAGERTVFWADLTSVSAGRPLVSEVARLLNVKDSQQGSAADGLLGFLSVDCGLLVLDNCEHMLTEAACLAKRLVDDLPALSVVCTSRKRLGVSGEVVLDVDPLEIPPHTEIRCAANLGAHSATSLFLDRLASVAPSCAVSDGVSRHVVEICRKVDGLPLAIEIAASLGRAVDLENLDRLLDFRLRVLANSDPSAHPRHRGLTALLDWSYELLSDEETLGLRELSVFVGGFDLNAASALMGLDLVATAETVRGLVEGSLLTRTSLAQTVRYSMLETVKEYASERLKRSESEEITRERHAQVFADLGWERNKDWPQCYRGDDPLWNADYRNMVAAFQRSLGWDGGLGRAYRLAVGMDRHWRTIGNLTEARDMLNRLLQRDPPDVDPWTRGRVLEMAFIFAADQNDNAAAEVLNEAYGRHVTEPRQAEGLARFHLRCANIEYRRGLLDEALKNYQLARDLYREANNAVGESVVLLNLGKIQSDLGDYASARTYLEDALRTKRDHGEVQISNALHSLGNVYMREGRRAEAIDCFERSLASASDVRERAFAISSLGRALHAADPLRSIELTTEAVDLFARMAESRMEASCLSILARSQRERGDVESAVKHWNTALEHMRRSPDSWAFSDVASTLIHHAAYDRVDPSATLILGEMRDWVRRSRGYVEEIGVAEGNANLRDWSRPHVERLGGMRYVSETLFRCGSDVQRCAEWCVRWLNEGNCPPWNR